MLRFCSLLFVFGCCLFNAACGERLECRSVEMSAGSTTCTATFAGCTDQKPRRVRCAPVAGGTQCECQVRGNTQRAFTQRMCPMLDADRVVSGVNQGCGWSVEIAP